jgi:predicted DsbA family dithiol-disulfide isomerase
MLGAEQLKIKVISDTIGPVVLCGKRRLERAIALLGNLPIEVGQKSALSLRPTVRTPNTLVSHQLSWLAGLHGRQDAVVEAIFCEYFCKGR